MKDVIGNEVREGDTIVHIGGGSSPHLEQGLVLSVEETRINVQKGPRWGTARKASWISNSHKIAVVIQR